MANNRHTNHKRDEQDSSTDDSQVRRTRSPSTRRAGTHTGRVPARLGTGRRRHLRPEPREQIDASTIGLCYWLIAQRIVREAEAHGDIDCPDPDVHGREAGEQS